MQSMPLPCGCDPAKKIYCSEGQQLLARAKELRELEESSGNLQRMELDKRYLQANARFYEHIAGD